MIQNLKYIIDDVLALIGAVSISIGAFLWNLSAGFIVFGLLMMGAAYLCSVGKGGDSR